MPSSPQIASTSVAPRRYALAAMRRTSGAASSEHAAARERSDHEQALAGLQVHANLDGEVGVCIERRIERTG